MEKNEIFSRFLNQIPQLTSFYDHEMEILYPNEMTEYLFFAYVLEPQLELAVSHHDMNIIRNIFCEIEWYIVNHPNTCEDMINTSLFEDLEELLASEKLDDYMMPQTQKMWKAYLQNSTPK